MKKLLLVLLVLFGLQTQAQVNYCDSLNINIWSQWQDTIILSADFGQTSGYIQTYDWNLYLGCGTCVGSAGDSMPIFNTPNPWNQDTIIACLTASYCVNNLCYVCTTCDTLVFNYFNNQWEMMLMVNNPTSIINLESNTIDNKIYDLLGRELTEIPVGKLYIRNQKLYITR